MRPSVLLLLLAIALTGCAAASPTAPSATVLPTSPAPIPAASAIVLGDGRTPDLPAIQAEQARRRAALDSAPYVLLRPGLTAPLDAAQRAAAADARVQEAAQDARSARRLTEVMAVGPAPAGDIPEALRAACAPGACTRVQLFVYAINTTLNALVGPDATVYDVQRIPGGQPEIPQDLADLATQIAVNSPATAEALGVPVTAESALPYASATKIAVVGTPCERSQHLCVSPVFTWGDQALWVIVDLTDLRLVGAATWTDQGQTAQRRDVSEQTLEHAALAPLCEAPHTLTAGDWQARYLLTSSDGLELRDVTYQGQLLLRSIKVVDWHVGYPTPTGPRVGFSDAVGCPVFSQAAITPYALPTITTQPDGTTELHMIFSAATWPQPCGYQYTFTATFAPDGTLTVQIGSNGRPCGVDGLYHPILRLALPDAPTPGLTLEAEGAATRRATEGDTQWPGGAAWAILAGPVRVTPAWGDATLAYAYWSVAKVSEGEGDLPSIGTCCALDIQQGPEQFITPPEPLTTESVLWYIPRMPNVERARCWADMELQDGVLVPHIWPCQSGVIVRSVP